jgi:hypothetical protein
MTAISKLTISLTGGLGNQLFQLAAGLSLSKNHQLYLTAAYGQPRINSKGQAEVLSFQLPSKVIFSDCSKAGWFASKVAGYLLRVGIAPKQFERSSFFRKALDFIASIVLSANIKELTRVTFSKNVGYSEVKIPSGNTLLIGYFQSHHWALDPEVKDLLMGIFPIGNPHVIERFRLLSIIEKPLVVHVRLGDYLNQSDFGIPSKDYYSVAIKKLLASKKYLKIWVFSDDLEGAKLRIPLDCDVGIRYIGSDEYSSAVTLEIMRVGNGYVIANSTFSWWAAFLSRNKDVEVVAPLPWFSGMKEPVDLIPNNWTRIESIHTINE